MPPRQDPAWLSRLVVELIHLEQLAAHGGRPGIRDEAALEAAVTRPEQRAAYGSAPDLAELAGALCFGIVRNHPFTDGNERTGFLAAYTFLRLNGSDLTADCDDVVSTIEGLAAGRVSEEELTAWIGTRRFRIEARDLSLREGIELDDIAGLLDRIEGPEHR